MRVLAAGIVWDSQETLPQELRDIGATQDTVRGFPSTSNGNPMRNLLPPSSISIDGRIVDDTAKVTVSQVFWNKAPTSICQGSYVFPLPSGCTVTSFSCRVGQKVLRAKIYPKQEAREAFHQAVTMGQTAAMLEQNTPEIFTASLGNIPANTKLEAELTYVTLLERMFSKEKDIATFIIPTAIANRYGNAPADIGGLATREQPHTFALQLEVMESRKVVEIKCETHKISLYPGPHKGEASNWKGLAEDGLNSSPEVAVIKLDCGGDFLQKDFILTIETSPLHKTEHPHAWIETHPSLEGQKAMMITIPPSIMSKSREPSTPGEVVFFIDRSGSMKDKIDAVKSSLLFFLKGIPIGWTFNIWSFGSQYTKLWENSQIYNSSTLMSALNYVEHFMADMGGTELYGGLEAMIKSRDISRSCDVIVLTDGQVWRLEETLELVRKARSTSQGAVRFFSLGIGAHVSQALVQGIASRGGGYSEILPQASMGGWEDRLVSMLKAALTSHDSTFKIEFGGDKDQNEILTSPADTKTLDPFRGGRIFVLSRASSSLDELSNLVIQTLNSNGDWNSTPIYATILESPDSTIHSLAVRAILDEFEHPIGEVINSDSNKARIHNEAQAEELACRFSLASKWSSFFLKQDTMESNEEDRPVSISIPIRERANLNPYQPQVLSRQRAQYPSVATQNNSNARSNVPLSAHAINTQYFGFVPYDSTANNVMRRQAQVIPPPPSMYFPYVQPDQRFVAGSSQVPAAAGPSARRHVQKSQSSRPRRKSRAGPSRSNYLSADILQEATAHSQNIFIANLLKYQNFDGSIGVEVCSVLGPPLTSTTQEIEEHISKNGLASGPSAGILAYTIVVVVLLERDLQDCEDLWDLMMMKSSTYISTQVPNESQKAELIEFAKGKLLGKELPLSKETTSQSLGGIEDFVGC